MDGIVRSIIFICVLVQCLAFDFYQPKTASNKLSSPKIDENVKRVHIIFMNHLDVGYDGIYPQVGFINNVINKYFTEYFPRAINVSDDLQRFGFVETFRYTTHPWLVDLYLNCPPNLVMSGVKLKCPSRKEVTAFANAVKTGVIQYHAGAMNMYYEVMDPLVMQMSLNISRRLDHLFQLKKPIRVMSQRDVPGVTIGAVPTLAENGILGITHGINSGSASPKFPLISRWKYGEKEVLYVQNPGGYPNNAGPYPANPGGLGSDQCRWLHGMTDALCFAFRTDNSGPPMNYNEVLSNYDVLRGQFPNAKLFASSLEDFFSILWKNYRSVIPVIYNEMGDTWVQGAGSDPRRVAEFKAVSRVLDQCRRNSLCDFEDPRLINASRFLVKLGEHTYGLNTAGDSTHWNNIAFAGIRNQTSIKMAESSWLEQREMTYVAVDALRDHPIRPAVEKAMADLKTSLPKYGKIRRNHLSFVQTCTGSIPASIRFASDGSIDSLVWNGKNLVKSPGKIGQLMYRTYNESDTAFFMKYYSYGWNTGYGKAGSTENAKPESRWWSLSATEIHKRENETCTFDVRMKHDQPQPAIWYGGASEYWITYTFENDMSLNVTLQWFNKTTTRLMETIYLGFSPDGISTNWTVSKIGYQVCPYSVVQNGSQWQHGVDQGGISLKTSQYKVNIQALDAYVVSPWTPSYGPTVWPAPLAPIPGKPGITGMAFPLYNNVWNTNFIYWYPFIEEDKNFKARFQVKWEMSDRSLRFRPARFSRTHPMI